MKKTVKLLQQFFEVYADKAPVNYDGPQKKADRAARWFWSHLTKEEQNNLEIARSHAIDCREGRGEFDEVCKAIRKRLFK